MARTKKQRTKKQEKKRKKIRKEQEDSLDSKRRWDSIKCPRWQRKI